MSWIVLSVCCFMAAAITGGWFFWREHRASLATNSLPLKEDVDTPSFKLSGSAEHWIRVLSGKDLLHYCQAGPTVDKILRQSRLSPMVFERDVYPAILNYAEFVQLAPASEAHHHAHPGGLLAHTLEVILTALTLRNGYLLPLNAPTEIMDGQRDHWTLAVFLAALFHDIGKIMTDLRMVVRDGPQAPIRPWSPLSGPMTRSRAWEYRVGFAPTAERDYLAHKKLGLILLQAIAPTTTLAFLGRENTVLDALSAYLGDEAKPGSAAADGAKSLMEIIKKADQTSVAHNLQHGPRQRFSSAVAVPLIERLMGTLRDLLRQGALPLNRDGAAGWVFDGAVYFVAKRLADTLRDQLKKDDPEEGIPGPTKNDRLFDTWQDFGAIDLNPVTGQAIWHVIVEEDNYRHSLAMLKFPLYKLFDDPVRYPPPMTGKIILTDKPTARAESGDVPPARKEKSEIPGPRSANAKPIPAPRPANGKSMEKPEPLPSPEPPMTLVPPPSRPPAARGSSEARRIDVEPPDEFLLDPVDPLPMDRPAISVTAPETTARSVDAEEIQAPKKPQARNRGISSSMRPNTPPHPPQPAAKPSQADDGLLDDGDAVRERRKKPSKPVPAASAIVPFSTPPATMGNAEPMDLAIGFMEWVQQGLASGSLPYNEPGAPIHFLPSGMALVSPRIFREYAEFAEADGNQVQQQVIGAGWHVKAAGNSNILHFSVLKRDGTRAGKLSAVVIAYPERWVNPLPPHNACIVPFEMSINPETLKNAGKHQA